MKTIYNFLTAAFNALLFEFMPIPLKAGSKITSVKWDAWQKDLCEDKIKWYWERNPTDELGIIVGKNMIVYDADTTESLKKLYELEKIFGLQPNHIVKTKKGEHHYFYRPDSVKAKSNSHSTVNHPERIDVKTDRSMVVRPPSTGKEMLIDEAESVRDFTPVTQEFVDAIDSHNGIDINAKSKNIVIPAKTAFTSNDEKILDDLLAFISPNCGHDEWIQIGMAIHHEMAGNIDGLLLWDKWSAAGSDFCGSDEITCKYKSFDNYEGAKVTIGTIISRAEKGGATKLEIQSLLDDDFEFCETIIVPADSSLTPTIQVAKPSTSISPLAKYSLKGKSGIYESKMAKEQFVIGEIALKGQVTAIYAQYNTGKTLIAQALLIAAIDACLIEAKDVYYVNADDNYQGLVTKMGLADEYGFNMLAPGHEGFEVGNLTEALIEMTSNGTAKDAIVFVDTLKKFADLMNKSKSTEFGQIARQLVSKGGTIILLAHVNKQRAENGKAVHAGTSDIIDDADCAYILDTIKDADGIKTVQFENIKSRGCVASKATYQYSVKEGISYNELIASVTSVDSIDAEEVSNADESCSEEACIDAIKTAIALGINTKMKLAQSVANNRGLSKRKVVNIIEKYTGDDPINNFWAFKIGERGAKIFELLQKPIPTDSTDQPL
jgi:hypothetical protein